MGHMNSKTKSPKQLSEAEIDQIVISQAVERSKLASLTLPGELAARATFLAQLHRAKSVEEWLARVIQERVELEEAVFAGLKQDLLVRAARTSKSSPVQPGA